MLRGNPLSPNRLILCPTDRLFSPKDLSAFVSGLQASNYFGDQWQADRYLIGGQFLSGVSFLGCAPSLQMEPLADPADLRFCHFHVPAPSKKPQLTASSTIKPPLCPHCRSALPTWRSASNSSLTLTCASCNNTASIENWIWRKKSMCFVRFKIDICNIFESEAVPSENLLKTLEKLSGTPWEYCYITP